MEKALYKRTTLPLPFFPVVTDFFDYDGHQYLVVGERFLGWVEVLSSTANVNTGGPPVPYVAFTPSSPHLVYRNLEFIAGIQRTSSAYEKCSTAYLLSPSRNLTAEQTLR